MPKKTNSCSGCGSCFKLKGCCFGAVFKSNKVEKITPITPLPKPPEVTDTTDVDILVIKSVNPCITENGPAHFTDKYDLMKRGSSSELVVRRGQSFKLILSTNRCYNEETDAISFIFTVADEARPSHGQGTLVPIPLVPTRPEGTGWSAVLESKKDNLLTVLITPSAKSVVAPWKMDIDTKLKNGGDLSYSFPSKIFILYNPWCKDDQVYMEDKAWRDECILADSGLCCMGYILWPYWQP